MSSVSKKRKNRPFDGQEHDHPRVQPDTLLFIQAHEADLVHGPQAASAARSLEVQEATNGEEQGHVGDGLIRWGPRVELRVDGADSDEPMTLSGLSGEELPSSSEQSCGAGVWVDRYDARLLLESLPDLSSLPDHSTRPSSPGGWSDLPSDAEDTFFFSVGEVEDYRREKRRRVMDRDREARLRAIRAEEGDDVERDPKDDWGGSDEEPDDAQHEFMRRTAAHILGSPNPAQLEMRILANHGADPRFAFLRGRWSRLWRLTKGKARLELEAEKRRKTEDAKTQGNLGIGGLAGYGDSDEESEGGGDDQDAAAGEPQVEDGGVAEVPEVADTVTAPEPDEAVKAARRARAREWAEKRRAAKEGMDARAQLADCDS
ncbi:hypothetical protein LXA43DRAFT_1103337 [Ganoderma leucocontextum]|nr:hypothetical protein LXA43DRAFT_1103337 [Ganoderma leucocontextum]